MSFFDWLFPGLDGDRKEREKRFEARFADEQSRRIKAEMDLARERDRADQAEARAEAAETRAAEAEESRKHCHEVLDALQDDLDQAGAKAMRAMQPWCLGGES